MANHLYSYTPSYGASSLSTPFSSLITSTSLTDPHLSDTPSLFSRYLTSDPTPLTDHSKYSVLDKGSLFSNDSLRLSSGEIVGIGAGALSAGAGIGATTPWTGMSQMPLTSVEPRSVLHSSVVDPVVAGIKRPVEALYHQNIVGTHSSIGQSDVMFSSNPLAKLPRIENASNLPIYPQRPGEKDCTHYMMTRICKFGDACKFDHPLWVPEGGIPDWKEVPLASVLEFLPERPGEPNCPYYLKTLKCKFGFKCKFNHPRDVEALKASLTAEGDSEAADIVLPERPNEPLCSLYAKTGKCKYGIHCKFNHPKDLEIPTDQTGTDKPPIPFTPALLHNSKGLPIRPGEVDCPFYLKTGSCKYSVTCRFNHPDRTAINPPVAAGLGHSIINSPAINPPFGVVNPTVAVLPHASLDPRLAQNALALGPTVYPQRPGNLECDHYMKTGRCDFGERCKFHHPINRPAVAPAPSLVNQALQPNIKLTLAGLPRREGLPTCAFYMKTGMCKFGVTCRFDHPPPGEVIALVASQGASVAEETS